MSEPSILHLHVSPPAWGLPSISPACAKLETWLRMAGVAYDKPPLDFPKAPKGKIPFIVEGDQLMGDSTLIIEHLGRTRGIDLDAPLSPRERAVSLAFRRMLKENDYWAMLYSRYVIAENWEVYSLVLGSVFVPDGPEQAQREVAEGVKQGILASMQAHGLGRHSGAEIESIACEDISAIATLLGDNEWMMGKDQPTTLDATVYGYIGNVIWQPFEDRITKHALAQTKLVALCERIRARYFA